MPPENFEQQILWDWIWGSGVAKVGNGWAQPQPIMSSAQPIFMSIVQPIYMHLPRENYIIDCMYNT